MINSKEILSIHAETVKAEILYDIKVKELPTSSAVIFYRAKFDKDRADEKKLCNIIYKNNG